jgi:O-antigen ligase
MLSIEIARVFAIIACVGLLYSPTVGSIGLIATYVFFLASGQAVARFKPVLARPSVYWGVAFLGIVLLAILYAAVPWQERWVDFYKWRTMLWFFVLLVLFDDHRWKERLLIAFIVGTAIAVAGSFVATAGWITLWRGPDQLLRNPATQGMAFAASALICLWMWLESWARGRVSWIWMILGGAYVLNVVFITWGRSGYAVLGLGIGVLLLWRTSPRRGIAVVLGLALLGGIAFFVSPRIQERAEQGIYEWTHEDESKGHTPMGTRRVFYRNALEIVQEHWLLGVGTGGFRNAYAEHVAGKYEVSDWRAEPTGDPHNQYLAVLAQHGVIGLAVFLLWIVAIVRDHGGTPRYRNLALAILCGWCVTSLFSSHFRTFAEGHLLMTFLGVLLAAVSPQPQAEVPMETPTQPSWWDRLSAS